MTTHTENERRDDQLPVSRRSVMKTGALASSAAVMVAATGRVAARNANSGYRPGTPVTDREDPDPDAAIVLASLDVPVRDWMVFRGETVADHNPDYASDDRVVIVAFEHLLESGWPNWRRGKPATLFDGVVDRAIKFHAFPQSRLQRGRRNRGRNKR